MKYFHPSNRDVPWVDWRLRENRREMFFRWLDWRLTWCDLDHYAVTRSYLESSGVSSPTGKAATEEQRYWMSVIFGMTYQSSMAWVIYWNFPNLFSVNLEEAGKWNGETFSRQRYARDTKYNKGRFPQQVRSVLSVVEPYGSLKAFFERLVDDDEEASFERVFNEIQRFDKFGRMTAWITAQNLFEVCNLPVRPPTVLATEPSNWSVRTGLAYLLGREDLIDENPLSAEGARFLSEEERNLYSEAKERISPHNRAIFSNFLLESHLCQFKKLLTGGDYGGHSSGDHVSRASWLRDRWPEVNFSGFFDRAVLHHHPSIRLARESPALRELCSRTGQVINMHQEYPDLPDMYAELSLNPELLRNPENDPAVRGKIDLYEDATGGNFVSESLLLGSY